MLLEAALLMGAEKLERTGIYIKPLDKTGVKGIDSG